MGRFESFVALRDFLQGKINEYQLAEVDPKIDRVNRKSDLGSSLLYYDFGDDDTFYKTIGVSDDDIYAINTIGNSYGNNYYSEESSHEDFNNGYGLWDDVYSENMDKFQLISQYIMKEPFESTDVSFLGRFAETLYKVFPRETRSFIMDYAYERDVAMKHAGEQIITDDLKEYFGGLGIQHVSSGEIAIPVQKLFDKFLDLGSPQYSIRKVLIELFKDHDSDLGGWNDAIWESDWEPEFDKDSFNQMLEKELDSIIEKLEDDESKAKDYVDMIQRVTLKHPQGYWKLLPKDRTKTVEYKVKGFDYKTQKIIVQLRKELKQKEYQMTEENFNNLLYQPELFNIGELAGF